MPCYFPIFCARSKTERYEKSQKPLIRFNYYPSENHLLYERFQLPCGRCIGCRLERSRQWAVRCIHEASLHDENCFVTLTYSDEHNPLTLVKSHYQKFIRDLRLSFNEHQASPDVGQAKRVRYYMCGEYGGKFGRPHYHLLLFGYCFSDLLYFKSDNGFKLYTSAFLDSLWPFGFALVGEVTFESAAYVARYCLKKVSGEHAQDYYDGLLPEFSSMSLKPGIGADWFDRYKDEVYSDDLIVVRGGKKCKPPRFYDKRMELLRPDVIAKIKEVRKEYAEKRGLTVENVRRSVSRSRSKWKVKQSQISLLKRTLI